MKIAIAIVTNRQVKPKTVLCLIQMLAQTEHDVFPIVSSEHYTTAEGRNYCVIQAIRQNCTHILFLDDDMTFPSDTIERLLAHGKELVGVYSYSRVLPLCSTVAFLDAEGNYIPKDKMGFVKRPETLFKCHSVGMGVALIDMKLFSVIDKPWFAFNMHESGAMLLGEDAHLCGQARSKGIDI